MKWLFVCFLFFVSGSFAQKTAVAKPIGGVWQGLLIKDGQSIDQAAIIYFEFSDNGEYIGRSREEAVGKDAYAVRKLKGTKTAAGVEFKQLSIEKKKDASGVKWCAIDAKLTFVDSTGYLEGKFTSSECRGNSGRIVCYPSKLAFAGEATVKELQSWRPIFADDLKKGRKAPAIREMERKNFRFEPIFFDYDKAEIKPEYAAFLSSMVKIVTSHTDLRIKVTGHTDADGSDGYNIDLSKRRAEAIIAYFVSLGLARDRIQIEFKGESDPIGDNSTSEGKQLNRRVDFAFI